MCGWKSVQKTITQKSRQTDHMKDGFPVIGDEGSTQRPATDSAEHTDCEDAQPETDSAEHTDCEDSPTKDDEDFLKPLDPKAKRRRLAVLDTRNDLAAQTKRNKQKNKGQKQTKKMMNKRPAKYTPEINEEKLQNEPTRTMNKPSDDDKLDEPLHTPSLTGPTNEKKSRIQLTAKNNVGHRIHICTVLLSTYGPAAIKDMCAIAHKVQHHNYFTRQCLVFKDSLKSTA